MIIVSNIAKKIDVISIQGQNHNNVNILPDPKKIS